MDMVHHIKRGRVRRALLVAVLALAGLAASPAIASTPGANGRIVYGQQVSGHFRLFTILPDGTGRTSLGRVNGDAVHPDWSPDGTRIVFELDHPHGPPFCSVEVVNADGSGLVDLTGNRNGCEAQPAFTPDGRRIVFERYDDKKKIDAIWSMDVTGGDRHQITTRKQNGVTDPNVSPDGSWITFVRIKKDGKLQALFAVHPDGSGLRQLTPFSWEVAIKHDWSPDGSRIVLTKNADFVRPDQSANLVTIRPDGTGLNRLTHYKHGKKNAFAGSFSPDGREIVFRYERGNRFALAVIDGDGHNVRLLTKLSKNKPRYIDWGTP